MQAGAHAQAFVSAKVALAAPAFCRPCVLDFGAFLQHKGLRFGTCWLLRFQWYLSSGGSGFMPMPDSLNPPSSLQTLQPPALGSTLQAQHPPRPPLYPTQSKDPNPRTPKRRPRRSRRKRRRRRRRRRRAASGPRQMGFRRGGSRFSGFTRLEFRVFLF